MTVGSGTGTSAGRCTEATPCFVCSLKAIVKEQGIGASFTDEPFVANLVGCRKAFSLTNKFDDRMIVFFALPDEPDEYALRGAAIDAEVIADVSAAAKELNRKKGPGVGVRLVACSRVELTPGRPHDGHRVVAMLPITTDPGLVRTTEKLKQLQAALEELQGADGQGGRIKELRDAKQRLTELLGSMPKGKHFSADQ